MSDVMEQRRKDALGSRLGKDARQRSCDAMEPQRRAATDGARSNGFLRAGEGAKQIKVGVRLAMMTFASQAAAQQSAVCARRVTDDPE